MGNLVRLRHFVLPEWSVQGSYKMPRGVDNLNSLQTLSTFIVGSRNISNLRGLSQLRGTLDICNLENIGYIGEAMGANLKNKPHLLGLRLQWSHCTSEDSFPNLDEDVLQHLQPPTNLKALWIENYGGTRLPTWIKYPYFPNLETVSLIDCHKCRFLPHLWKLPLLNHLVIQGCSAIKIVGSDGDGSSADSEQFRSLETLRIEFMEEWKEWPEKGGSLGQFPCLRELFIIGCPKLRIISHHFPCLVELAIEKCDELRELPKLLPSLRRLHIKQCPKLVLLQQCDITKQAPDGLVGMKRLCYLDLSETSMKVFPQSLVELQRLQTLKLSHNRELVSLPNDIHKLECLHFLDLSNIGIRVLPTTFGELFELCHLDLSHTPIETLPESMVRLERLRTLNLSHCNSLSGSLHYMTGWKNIECLDLSFTGIEMLSEFVSNLDNLEKLKLDGCSRLAGLPSDMVKLSKGIKLSPSMMSTEGQYSPDFLLDQLNSHLFKKTRDVLRKPNGMGLGDITLICSPLLQVLQRLEMSLTMLRDAELQKLGDPAKHKCLEHQPLFEGLGHMLEHIASCVSEQTPLSELPLQDHLERDEALDIINSIYDNSVALSNISLQLETIEMAEGPDKDPLLPVHIYHEIVQSKPGKEQASSMDTKINEGSTSEVANTSEVCKSFHNLPQHLKRCVIYTCNLFLGDYEFEEDTLIQLWIGVGFIQTGEEQLAERGRIYFKELHRLFIFQMSSSIVCENYESTYRVHKDVCEVIKQCCPDHEYAISMEDGGPNKISPVTLHSILLVGDKICNFNMKLFESRIEGAELLRTLKLQNECGSPPIKHISHNLFVKLRFLRVLDLSCTEIKELPTSVCNLRHLRYLDVSNTRIRKLPESVSKLYNLETLKLRDCSDLIGLPNEMSKLNNRQYLDLDGVHQLNSMPPRMGQLTNLHTLSIFIVGKAEGFRIEELKCMKKLRGSLCIAKMENVTKDEADDDEAQLVYKDAIHKLEFQWSSSESKCGTEFNLIEPHLLIEQLKIIWC
ncbi:putative disease resistance protein At3g14460 [Telopea speciosissima]|uniref:putative disease resistance protein At3g14460 n=1 Tax=Telopea speciosissima TaxID=54955 RepID=UPI001CC78636|nr:putative disease resistance protein At3g14460 [Telopea speciosissima]